MSEKIGEQLLREIELLPREKREAMGEDGMRGVDAIIKRDIAKAAMNTIVVKQWEDYIDYLASPLDPRD